MINRIIAAIEAIACSDDEREKIVAAQALMDSITAEIKRQLAEEQHIESLETRSSCTKVD